MIASARRAHADTIGSDFDRDGSAVVRGAIDSGQLAAMRSAFADLVPDAADEVTRQRGGVVREVSGAARTHAALAAVTRDAKLGAMAADALGARRVQFLQDSLLSKPAHTGGAIAWHQDYTYVAYLTPPQVLSIRIPLEPEDERNGCMRVVDGSHRWGPIGVARPLRAGRVSSLVRSLDAAQRRALARARSVALAPGDVSIHHCLTVHSSAMNHSDRARRTIILRFFDADCRLVAARLPDGAARFFPTDGDGHLATRTFPMVYSARR